MAEIILFCEECGKRKIYFNTVEKIGWCHYCKRVITAKEAGQLGVDNSTWTTIRINEEVELIPAAEDERCVSFLAQRFISIPECYRAMIMYSPARDRLYFPISSPSPELEKAYHTRTLKPEGKWITTAKERSNYCFGLQWIPKEIKEIVLVEGIFDILSPGWLGYGIATLGTVLSDSLLLYISSRYQRVTVWYDPDEAGVKGAREVSRKLHYAGVDVISVDASFEPGDMGPQHPKAILMREYLNEVSRDSRYPHPFKALPGLSGIR